MLRSVQQHLDGTFTATDEMGRRVLIIESISFLFNVQVDENGKSVNYKPIDYHSPRVLTQVERFLTGKKFKKEVIESIVVRFGWMDKRLNKLSFLPLTDLMDLIRKGEADKTQKRKLVEICKQLSLSMKHVIK